MVKYKTKPEMEISFQKGQYKQGLEDEYELEPQRDERPIFEEKPLPEERVVTEIRTKKEAMPRMVDEKIKPLKLLGSEVIGGLFDRVEFLKKRINEINDTLALRENIHNEMLSEIELDIKDKDSMSLKVTDIDEKRNFKLDISILRKEKRLEMVQYWRDVTELKSELRELMEKFEVEKKILAIFNDLKPMEGLDGGKV